MSMICCEKCASCVDSDFHAEVFREGYVFLTETRAIVATYNPKDCVPICDYCFDGFEELEL